MWKYESQGELTILEKQMIEKQILEKEGKPGFPVSGWSSDYQSFLISQTSGNDSTIPRYLVRSPPKEGGALAEAPVEDLKA